MTAAAEPLDTAFTSRRTLVLRRFLRNRAAVGSLAVLVLLQVAMIILGHLQAGVLQG